MELIIENTRTGSNKYEWSQLYEKDIQKLVSKVFNLRMGSQSTEYDPSYDFILNNTLVEFKMSRYEDLLVEYSRGNGSPSGISVSKAKLYMTLNSGWTGKKYNSKPVGKLRIYKTYQLKDCIEPLKDHYKYSVNFKEWDGGCSSKCVKLTNEMIKTYKIDIGLLDIGLIWNDNKNKVIGFNTDNVKACGNFNYVRGKVWNMFS